ncbi:YhcN/YlaJ family sporulation lipoprotein [Pseudalkalibacillus berkeleyi]|uniref:YhcN/YlaJ family sporulation lipoprotein n=1 Tax=Pseudalkalibacillus berkeleyi TaxID=1069813 RepID=A0ABS9H2D4_9BACL|nr:YhcN/YlaJ family sporulation lipoprotein [Pseudalkalibacillus berkeleyi]MCF6138081.1 YhcN/YlaJ family sporulation lipoprotein [Pseudalkalibacillus berkeleyi]
MKKIMMFTSALLLTSALTACNADDNEALDTRYDNDTRPIGYYTNDGRGEGPMTRIADRDRKDLDRKEVNYADDYQGGDLARRISKKVNNMRDVDDARVVVTRDSVLIGVDTNDRNDRDVKPKVKSAVKKMTDKDVRVTTDEDMFTRIRDVDNDLRDGNGYNEVESDVNAIMNDIGDALRRPFENNR